MSASETHGEKPSSDEEDFKPNIPYFDNTNNVAQQSPSQKNNDNLNQNIMEGDEEDINYNYCSWENDDDDNFSKIGSVYESYSGSDSVKFFSQCNQVHLSTSPSTSAYPQAEVPEMKYKPQEILLRPPSSSTLNFQYTYPQTRNMSQLHQRAFINQPQSSLNHGRGGSHYSAYSQHSAEFQPNMWYPNVPYGSGEFYGSYGSLRYSNYSNTSGYPHDPMVDMLQLSNSGREARNRAEKNRRDKLNGSIQQLSALVPHVSESPRRVDKTAVLRFAAHGLRLQYVFGETLNQSRPQVTDALMKLLDSFFITLTCHGQIVLISSSIEEHLGHCQADLYGQNILHITHPEDHNMLKQQLIPTDLETLFDIQPDDDSGETRPRTKEEEENIDRKLREDRRSFTVRLARAGPRTEPTSYEVVKLDGNFRRSDWAPRGIKTSTFPSSLQLIRRTRGRDDSIPLHTISGNDIVLIVIARIIRPPKIINRVMEANSLEYKTRHLIDGRIIDCDQRIGLVAGYMKDEVRNLSPFTFIHQDDVRWVIVALRQMYDCHSSYGESAYRLITRTGNFIYLQTKGYLEIDKDTNKVHSFVCVNTLLNEDEGKRRVQEMKNKFSIIINTKIPQPSTDMPASENPQQLEKAVLCLIQNLQKSSSDDEEDGNMSSTSSSFTTRTISSIPMPSQPATHNVIHLQHQSDINNSASTSAFSRKSKTPPLALVPPEASSVKTSISKSINVVNVTAAKHLRDSQQTKFPLILATTEDKSEIGCNFDLNSQIVSCDCSKGLSNCEFCQNENNQHISGIGMKRSISYSNSTEAKMPKRIFKNTEIERVLSNSLNQIGRTLDEQLNAAIELRDQSNKYEVPISHGRIDAIIEEHQKQSQMYVNIKSEYEVQMQNKNSDISTTKSISSDPETIKDVSGDKDRDHDAE